MEGLIGFAVAFFATVIAGYFLIFSSKTDPRVKELAKLAYACAGKIAELPAKGSPPSVNLKKGRWKNDGIFVIGNYKWRMVFGKVIWDRILVVDNPENIWPNLVHEMTHAVRRRAGKVSSEAAAESAEAQAYTRCGSAEVDVLLEKLR